MKTQGCLFLFLMLLGASAGGETVKRVRNEGGIHCRASNVMGSGNIAAQTGISSSINKIALHANPYIGVRVGIAGIIQLGAQTSLEDFSGIGPSQAHLQVTTPGNDKLRLFGLAISADLYFSTSPDTFSLVTENNKPEYSPYLTGSVLADIDWLSLWKSFPLKTYLNLSMVDDPQTLHRYHQVKLLFGNEWKMQRNSFFIESGAALYKEKKTRFNLSGDSHFEQGYAWIQGGGRVRFGDKISIVGGLGITVGQKMKDKSDFRPGLVMFDLQFEMPIVFKETATEAIRTLVFIDRRKHDSNDPYGALRISEQKLFNRYSEVVEGLDLEAESFDYQSENLELRKKREEIQEKMRNIEQILKETEE